MIEFNIKPIFQVSLTPYSNVLDLGIWCGLQATIKNTYYIRKHTADTLVRSVYKTWEKGEWNDVKTKWFNHLKIGLVLIIEGDSRNKLIETERGKDVL